MSYFDVKAPSETIVGEGTSHQYVRQDHEAYGQVTIQRERTNGNEETLFDSDLTHKEVIQITLRRAHVARRNYNSDIMDEEVIARFNMSGAQWSEMISSPSMGKSVPVTLRHAPQRGTIAEGMPMIDEMSIQERQSRDIEAKFAQYMESGKQMLAEMERISASKNAVSKPELRELLKTMEGFVNGLPGNFAYMHGIMQKEAAQMIANAKTEIAAHVESVAQRVGFEQLRKESPASLSANEASTKQ